MDFLFSSLGYRCIYSATCTLTFIAKSVRDGRMLCEIFPFKSVAQSTFHGKQQFQKLSVFYIYLFSLDQEMEESTVLAAGWNFDHVILILVQKAKSISGSNSALNLMANTLISTVLHLLFAGFQNTVVVSNYKFFSINEIKMFFLIKILKQTRNLLDFLSSFYERSL